MWLKQNKSFKINQMTPRGRMAVNDFKEGSDVLNIEYSGFFEESLF